MTERKTLLFVDPDSSNYEQFGPKFLDVSNGKGVIFGIPKCGNAWLQSMLCKYFECDPILTREEIESRGILSIHEPFYEYMTFREDFIHGVCLIRDIRDVIDSYYQYTQTSQWLDAMTRFKYEDFDSFYYEWFLSRAVPSHQLHSFADKFAERSIPIVRYERLHSRKEAELARLVFRWGFQPDRARMRMWSRRMNSIN